MRPAPRSLFDARAHLMLQTIMPLQRVSTLSPRPSRLYRSLLWHLAHYRLPILSGILIGTSYIPFPPSALFFCLCPLFVFWIQQAKNARQAVIGGWITQF